MDGGETFDIVIRPPHGDQHDLWIDPNNPLRMCNSNDGGGNVSVNGGDTWTGQAYSTTQLYHVNVTNDFPYHVCGAQQDNTTLCTPSEGWDHMQARGPGSAGTTTPAAARAATSPSIPRTSTSSTPAAREHC